MKINAPKHKRNVYTGSGLDPRVYMQGHGTVLSDYSMNSLGSFDNHRNRPSQNTERKEYQA